MANSTLSFMASLVLVSALGCSGSPASHPDAAGLDAPAADGPESDAASDAISAPDDQWTWIDFPDSKCASGTPTGIGINPHAGATNLIVYFKGGGGCTTGATCWARCRRPRSSTATAPPSSRAMVHPRFRFSIAATPGTRSATRTWCSCRTARGDMHVGTKEIDLQVNGTAKPTYFWAAPTSTCSWRASSRRSRTRNTSGSSARARAGLRACTYEKIASAFAGARVDILDDSGPPILAYHATQNANLAYWGFSRRPPARRRATPMQPCRGRPCAATEQQGRLSPVRARLDAVFSLPLSDD